MDDLDARLIVALRRNGRAGISQLAAELGVSRNTVRARMARLQQQRDIVGYTAILKADVQRMPVRGVTLIAIEGKGAERVISRLNAMPEVTAIHTTNGRWDLVIELAGESLDQLDAILRRIRLIDGVAHSETSLYLATRRSSG